MSTPAATPNWAGLEGTVFEGGYELENCLDVEASSAYFKVRVLGDRLTKAVAQVFAPGSLSAEELQLLKDSAQLRHPNLAAPLAVGEVDRSGALFPYLVLVKPDETLSEVIRGRALTPEETREVVRSAASALEFLHGNGFTHSGLAPDQILAIGDSIKLSTAGIRKINTPVNGEQTPSPAADVFRLGATVFEVLTQKPWDEARREDAAELPHPFNAIVQGCLDPDVSSRCTLPDVRTMLASRKPAPAPKPEAVQPAPIAPVIPIAEPRPRPEPVLRRDIPPLPIRRERLEEAVESSPFKKSAYLLLALLLAVGVLWLARPKSSRPHPTVNPNPAAPTESSEKPVNNPGSSWPTRAVGPGETGKSVPLPSTAGAPASRSGATGEWRVVSFTYDREEDANKKAEAINAKYPGFHPEVFSPNGKGGPYVVTLGGHMTREEALRMRQKARSSGLPRDSYIQNYSH